MRKDQDRKNVPRCNKCDDIKGLVNYGKRWKCVNPNCPEREAK